MWACTGLCLTSAAPATVSGRLFAEPAFISSPLGVLQTPGKALKVVSTSPDTGQQGGFAPGAKLYAHALSGKAVRVLVC